MPTTAAMLIECTTSAKSTVTWLCPEDLRGGVVAPERLPGADRQDVLGLAGAGDDERRAVVS